MPPHPSFIRPRRREQPFCFKLIKFVFQLSVLVIFSLFVIAQYVRYKQMCQLPKGNGSYLAEETLSLNCDKLSAVTHNGHENSGIVCDANAAGDCGVGFGDADSGALEAVSSCSIEDQVDECSVESDPMPEHSSAGLNDLLCVADENEHGCRDVDTCCDLEVDNYGPDQQEADEDAESNSDEDAESEANEDEDAESEAEAEEDADSKSEATVPVASTQTPVFVSSADNTKDGAPVIESDDNGSSDEFDETESDCSEGSSTSCTESQPLLEEFINRLAELKDVHDENDDRLRVVDEYLELGADPNAFVADKSISPAMFAAKHWMVHVLKRMGPIDLTAENEDGLTILHVLCDIDLEDNEQEAKAEETLKYLLAIGNQQSTIPNSPLESVPCLIDIPSTADKFSPLTYAIDIGHYRMAKLLLENGANPDGPTVVPDFLFNPLILAVYDERVEFVSLLLSHGANLLACNKYGVNALQAAVIDNRVDVVKLIFENLDPNAALEYKNIQVPRSPKDPFVYESELPVNLKHRPGFSLLHFAVYHGKLEMTEYLLFELEVDRNLRDADGFSAHTIVVNVYADFVLKDHYNQGKYTEYVKASEKILNLFKVFENKIERFTKRSKKPFFFGTSY